MKGLSWGIHIPIKASASAFYLGAHDTLQKSLDSYPADFLDQFDQNLIYFSDISEEDKNIAHSYNWSFNGGPNEGIAAGMKHLAKSMNTDYVLCCKMIILFVNHPILLSIT